MLNALFIDMNSYFASVEQQLVPELRHRPVIVAAVPADTTCCIAASYEAKALGIRTGTMVGEAKRRCRDVRVVVARPEMYVRYHHRFLLAIDSCLPIDKVRSIDEASCRLRGEQRSPAVAIELAQQIKAVLREQVGEYIRCSIGIAPNVLLAKVASDMQKPDGLTVVTLADLPNKLLSLALTDLPGIGPRMFERLRRQGIRTMQDLYDRSEAELREVWGSVVGGMWWYWLRGIELPEPPTHRRSVGHSHVLPPEMRTPQGAYVLLTRLIHKAAARLRRLDYWAGELGLEVDFGHREVRWQAKAALGVCQDTLSMIESLVRLWPSRPAHRYPTKVSVTLGRLQPARNVSPSLFAEARSRQQLAAAMDRVNNVFGDQGIYFAGMHRAWDTAPTRIAFTSVPELEAFGIDEPAWEQPQE